MKREIESPSNGEEGVREAREALSKFCKALTQPPGSQPPLPHWCDRNWDRLRCRVCKAEAWSLADIKHKPDCHIEQPPTPAVAREQLKWPSVYCEDCSARPCVCQKP